MKKTKKSKAIQNSLIEQLEFKGADVAHFIALVDDYMAYYVLSEAAKADLLKRGTTYTAVSAVGKEYEKDNPNAKLLPQYTRQMLSILKDLGITTENVQRADDAEGDYL